MGRHINVTVWNEFLHEVSTPEAVNLYPNGMHSVIAEFLRGTDGIGTVRTATLNETEHGLTEEVLADTDVLIWWGHMGHKLVEDAIADRVHERVLDGMGLICLHSSHRSKIFMKLCGTSGKLRWRADGERERLWAVKPNHPIAAGIKGYIEIPKEEMYGEPFDIPDPDELIFVSWFEGGEVFRSGFTWYRGNGKIFYFRPGHETFPVYYQEDVQRVIKNAVLWARPDERPEVVRGWAEAPEKKYTKGKIKW